MSWRARYGFSPSPAMKRSKSSRASPSRFVRDGVAEADMLGPSARADFDVAEEEADFARRGVRGIRAVHHVLLDACSEVGADRAGCSLLRIGGAHEIAVARDGVVAFEDLHDHRA